MAFLKSKCQQAPSFLPCVWQCSGTPWFFYPSLLQAYYISACDHFHQFDSQKITLFSFLQGMRQESSSASAGGPKPPLTTSVAEQYLRSLLHSACSALVPLVSLPSSLGSTAAGFSPVLLQEVTSLTV